MVLKILTKNMFKSRLKQRGIDMKLPKTILILLSFFVVSCPALLILLNITNSVFIIIPSYLLIAICLSIFVSRLEKKETESFFENERNMLYSILDDVKAIIIVWSDGLKTYTVNDSFYEKTGFKPQDIADKKDFIKIFGKKSDSAENILVENFTSQILCADSSCLTIEWKTTVLREGKKNLYLSVGVDVTDVIDMKDRLCATEEKIELSMELSEIGLIFRNVDSQSYVVSQHLQTLFGFDDTTVSFDEFNSLIHPDDLCLFNSYMDSKKYNSVSAENDITSFEIRIQCQNGEYRWFNYRFKATDLIDTTRLAIGGCLIDVSTEKEKDTLIEKMAYIDDTTQIFNRNRFIMLGEETYECSKELGISYWLIVLDIDKFHLINDTCGYNSGSKILKDIAYTVVNSTGEGNFCARIGGDNFAIMIRDIGDEDYPVNLIYDIQTKIEMLNSDVSSNQKITASAGYCQLPADGEDFSKVLEHAEFALRIGELPRSNIVRYDNGVHEKILQRSSLEKELELAIENDELRLFYQPKISLATESVVGVEALIRWIKPDGTIIPPSEFIPIAESSILITKISEFVLREACQQNKIWQEKGLAPINISVNLSSVDFYQTDVCRKIKDAIQESGLAPEWLEVELTESLALKDVDHAITQMNELKRIGVKISMDDFGTGYSSLSYIQVLPITMLKLDRSFVMNLVDDEVSRQIVSSVINICKSKDIEIIAEGIETRDQADILRNSGCDHAQGYFFGKPMPSHQFEEYLKKAN